MPDVPRTGKALAKWLLEQESCYSFAICRYIHGYGRLNQFPSRLADWADWQVDIAYEEGCRRLSRVV